MSKSTISTFIQVVKHGLPIPLGERGTIIARKRNRTVRFGYDLVIDFEIDHKRNFRPLVLNEFANKKYISVVE